MEGCSNRGKQVLSLIHIFTTKITDLSGYLIMVIGGVLTMSLLAYNQAPLDYSRLFTFTNFTGSEGSVWPASEGMVFPFLLGLLLAVYTITGFDASAHTAEETRDAARAVPKGIVSSVIYSAIFGYVMICTFVLVMPDVATGVKPVSYTHLDVYKRQHFPSRQTTACATQCNACTRKTFYLLPRVCYRNFCFV